MAGDLVRHGEALPGLLPAEEVRNLVSDFIAAVDIDDSGRSVLPRLPNGSERQVMIRRRDDLERQLEGIGRGSTDHPGGAEWARARQALAALFGGYTSLRNANVPDMLDIYLGWLSDLPGFAIVDACREIGAGKGRLRDPVNGEEESVGIKFPPNETQMHMIASRMKENRAREFFGIEKVLRIDRVAPRQVTDEERARIGVQMQALADSMRISPKRLDDPASVARSEASMKANESMIEELWRDAGYEPMRGADGRLRTPSLLATLGGWPPKGAKRIKKRARA